VAADVLVLPSHEEVWGLVLNEAAASGLPLVTTNVVGAAPDVIHAGVNGFSVPAGRPDCLARAIRKVLERPEEMGDVSRQIILGRNYEQNVAAILQAVEATVG
jgi:glycosyltransferase involved in cell wall biosynthesis